MTGLSRSLRVLIFEPTAAPGSSAPGRGDHSDRSRVEEIVGLLEELGHWPAHLIAVGRAGGWALDLARERPELVRGLILHEPDGPGAARLFGSARAREEAPSARR
ncbi:MAG: hypothetical protein AAFA34_05320, partial [Thermoplasmata archaeon]